jgi:hypothetical protein
MPNCAKHLCPLILTREKTLLCPVSWMLDRFHHTTIKDVLFEDELLNLVFQDGLSLRVYSPTRQDDLGQWIRLELDAEGFLELLTGAQIHEVAYILDDPSQGIYYLQIGLMQAPTGPYFRAVIEFLSLLDEASQHQTHFIGGSNGKK